MMVKVEKFNSNKKIINKHIIKKFRTETIINDYLNFLKRGVGRSTIQATDDVKRGLITRSEGMELAKINDSQRPHALDFYMDITGLSEEEIEQKIIKSRNLSDFAKKLNKE